MEHQDRRLFLNTWACPRGSVRSLLWAVGLAVLMMGPRPAAAQLPSRVDEPYRLTVCLHLADDLIFTRFFSESLRRQVRDQLVNYFGPMAEVEVVTAHAVLEKLAGGNLDELSLSSADFKEEGFQDKLFLMAVDFRDGVYRMRWRQLDGDVQQVGPLYSRTTPDRQWLAKAICTALKQDFAPVADVEPDRDGSQVDLSFRGSGRGDRLAAWLEAGAVLKPYWVVQQQDGSLACLPIPYTMLEIAGEGEWTRATVVTGLANPWKRTARVAGFRAIRLTTQTGRFRLRLLSTEDGSPVQTCTVLASQKGFEETSDADRLPGPDREGYVVATADFDRLAYVTVRHNGEFKLLLPITETWCELELRIPVDERAAQRTEWLRRLRYCVQDIQILQFSLNKCFQDVNQMNQDKRYEEALKRAGSAAKSLRPLIMDAGAAVADVASEADDVQMSSNSLLAWAKGQMDELDERGGELRDLENDLADTIEKIDAQSRAKVLIKLAGQAERSGDVDDAIEKYALALEEWPNQQVKQQLEKLREDWRIKSPEQEQARQFVYQRYAEAQADEIRALLPEARSAFRVLVGVDDYLAVGKLLNVNAGFVGELTEIVQLLIARGGEADRAEWERYEALAQEVLDFQEQVVEYAKAREEGRPAAAPGPADEGRSGKTPPPANSEPPAPKDEPAAADPKPSAGEEKSGPPVLGEEEEEEPPV